MNEAELRAFAQKHLMPESGSTNPSHRVMVALAKLNELSSEITDEDYEVFKDFIRNGFDLSRL